ncbi:MAG: glutathione S-transferase family protein [Alphaproteobacteria bacterium]|nr:glutathione S-transferase family protein [Alphaproteobacteria bacterium]
MTYTLWGAAHSLYSGKMRSYLIKKGLPYQERYPSDPDFGMRILPAVGHMVVPVVETPAGEILQDSGDIIDLLEARYAEPVLDPVTPVQKAVSALFDGVGSEYFMPLAMHYRWTYRADQEAFLQAEFGRAAVAGQSRADRRKMAGDLMCFFSSFLPNLGVFPETVAALEAPYMDWLDALDEHFQHHPYLLGGRPCRGDFGMMASFFAHLGRDPVPADLMKKKAPNLYRWTERMNLAAIPDGEYPGYGTDYVANDAIPETLEAVLSLVFRDWTPGLAADIAAFNAWAAMHVTGDIVSDDGARRVHPSLGAVAYPFHGVEMKRGSAPHAVWMFAAAQAQAKAMTGDAAARFGALLDRTGGHQMFSLTIDKAMARANNVLVLA